MIAALAKLLLHLLIAPLWLFLAIATAVGQVLEAVAVLWLVATTEPDFE